MDNYATFERTTVLRDHPAIVRTMFLKAAEETEFVSGSVIALDSSTGVVALAGDSDTPLGVLMGKTTVGTDETQCSILVHGDCVLDMLTIAEGATAETVASKLLSVGVYAY